LPSNRPVGWKPKKEIQDKIKEKLASPRWENRKRTIERLQKEAKEKEALKESTKRG
jgi:hypothetical protein